MYGEMLAEGLGDPTKSQKYARRIADESERLGRVVANVLGFSRLERGTLAVKPSPGDLSGVIQDCVNKQRPAIEAVGASLEVNIEPDLPQVLIDEDAVFQIISNLIDNAEKYTRDCDNRLIQVEVTKQSNHVEVTVTDHGRGIPGESRKRLFKPFARGSNPGAPAGLGLGLPLARALAKAQRATIEYRDTPEIGATFVVKFPLV